MNNNFENYELLLSDDKIFYTIEGEGEYIGYPSVFMRLSLCNLSCIGFKSDSSPHGCDSFVSWSVKNKLTFQEINNILNINGYKDSLKNGAIFKITGGEPMVQQNKLLQFFDYINKDWGWIPRIDFETNATIQPDNRWIKEFNATFTTSPKLSNNGDPMYKRYVPNTLTWHVNNGSGFKFVVSNESDIDEIITEYVDKFDIPAGKIWLMPCCGSREEHIEVAPMVVEIAKKYHFNFSPRLQLLIYDKALKV